MFDTSYYLHGYFENSQEQLLQRIHSVKEQMGVFPLVYLCARLPSLPLSAA